MKNHPTPYYFVSVCVLIILMAYPLQESKTSELPQTAPLTWEEDLSSRMMDGAHQFVERKIDESIGNRKSYWNRDFSSEMAYNQSVESNRRRLREIIGVIEKRVHPSMERFGDDHNPALIADMETYSIHQVRWPVLDGLTGEGLLLQPKQKPVGYVVALPDADQIPEQIVGLTRDLDSKEHFARHFVENGFTVVVPTLIDRSSHQQDSKEFRKSEQTNREWIYRQSFHMGRHVIGFEIQKVLAAVDWFMETMSDDLTIGVAGYGEGGLIAFYSAAVDTRIDSVLVSGYFNSRQAVWSEPIFRNVWGLLKQFGDAEIASLIAPRDLIIEYSAAPQFSDKKGAIQTPSFQQVQDEFNRIETLVQPGFQRKMLIHGPDQTVVGPGSESSLNAFAVGLGMDSFAPLSEQRPVDLRRAFDPSIRQRNQLEEMEEYVQDLVRASEHVRDRFYLHRVMPEFTQRKWSTEPRLDTHPANEFIEESKWYRDYFWEEAMGKFDEPLLPPNPRTRKIYDNDAWEGYDIVLDVWPEVFAWGVLLIPKDIKPGEKRPVIVCQHGRAGIPKVTIEEGSTAYNQFAARLAERGFVTFAPHNLYRGEDRYRWLDRKANNVKASLFSFIISQHQQILNWLDTLAFVDGDRMAFYGLSYGGETAMRVPSILEDYCLSICSGDFNQWTRKVAATDQWFSFMHTIEWEMPYFNLGHTFDYAEMAYLIFPRPFMVERGHLDRVGEDHWVAHEYAKVRWLYAQLGLSNKTQIDYFQGGHSIRGEGTFDFLHHHLNWPKPKVK